MTVFRSVREISFNAVKHAHARYIEVSLAMTDGQLVITVQDDGIGFDYEQIEKDALRQEHFGLFSVRERLEYLGGRFRVETAPGEGTKVVFGLPVSLEIKQRTW